MRRSRLGVVALLLAVGVGLLAAPASTPAQAPTRPLAEGWNNASYPGLPLDVEAALGATGRGGGGGLGLGGGVAGAGCSGRRPARRS